MNLKTIMKRPALLPLCTIALLAPLHIGAAETNLWTFDVSLYGLAVGMSGELGIGRVTADTGADTGTVTGNFILGSYHRRDDRPPPRGGRAPGDQNPGDESPGDQLPGGLQPWDPPAHRQRRSPDYDKWDTPASTSDLWTDLWVDSRPGDDT